MAWNRDEDGPENRDEGEEEGLDETNYNVQKDAVLFAIEVSDSMLAPPPTSNKNKKADTDSPLLAALKCANQMMQQRIIAQPKDMMGIILFGTDKSKFRESGNGNASGTTLYPHCYLFTDLDVPEAEDVKTLMELIESREAQEAILVPSKQAVSMMNLLFCANQVFTSKAPTFGSRRLYIITDNDSPHCGSKEIKKFAATRAKDLYDLGVVIELFPISREGGKTFDSTKFYDDIIYRDPAAGSENGVELPTAKSGDGLSLLTSLTCHITSKQPPKHSLFSSVPFEIAPGFTISIKGYMPIHKQEPARTCLIDHDGEKAQIATAKTVHSDKIGRTVEKSETKKAFMFGQDTVLFTSEQLQELKDFGRPVLRIIGFKPRCMLPVWAAVKKSIFIFPTEEGFVGSTRVFSALWKKLLRDEKVGLAWFKHRNSALPLLVAIIPSRSRDDGANATPYLPTGLWLSPLPFADDVTLVSARKTLRASDNLTNKMSMIVRNLQLPRGLYVPGKYPNPALQFHYKVLQALALQENAPDAAKAADLTLPKTRQIGKRVGGYLEEWQRDLEAEAKAAAAIRAIQRGADEEERPAKRAKNKATGGAPSDAQLRLAWQQGTLQKMTLPVLKDVMASKGLGTKGQKVELVERLEQWIEDKS